MLGCYYYYYYYYFAFGEFSIFFFWSDLTTNVDQLIDLRLFTKFLQLSIKLEAAYIVNLSSYSEV